MFKCCWVGEQYLLRSPVEFELLQKMSLSSLSSSFVVIVVAIVSIVDVDVDFDVIVVVVAVVVAVVTPNYSFSFVSASWRVLADFYFAQSSVQLHLSKISSVQSFLSFGQFHSLLRIKLLHF